MEVWIIGADHWTRAYLRAELIERGHDALGFVNVRDAVVRAAARRTPPALIVVDLHEQPLDEKLAAALFGLGAPVIAVAGAAEADDEAIRALPWAALLRRPLTIGTIADEVAAYAWRRRSEGVPVD